VRVEYLVGMAKVGKGFVLLLDLDSVLTAGENDVAQRAAARHAPVASLPTDPAGALDAPP
jgi:purine-binding chemotaxis protein CheW